MSPFSRFVVFAGGLIALPSFAEIVTYQFAGASPTATLRGTFFFDTDRVLNAISIRGGTEWAFHPGGLGVSTGGVNLQNPENPSFHFIACQADVNGRDNFTFVVSGLVHSTLTTFTFALSTLSGALLGSPCFTLPRNLSFSGIPVEGEIIMKIGSVEERFVPTLLRRIGGSQDTPILPDPGEPVECVPLCFARTSFCFCFRGAPNRQWFDPPSASGYEYRMADGLFTRILDFPTGFLSPFTVVVNGAPLGQYRPGQSADFTGFPGGGVASFRITGINPAVDAANPAAFPIKLEFNKQAATFAMLPLTETVLQVAVDIKPGTFPNTINLGSNGVVPVAILSTAAFDARNVDPATVTVASAAVKIKPNGSRQASFEDVNGDRILDLVVHVSTEALKLTSSNTEAVVEGRTFDGRMIRGTDSIRVVP